MPTIFISQAYYSISEKNRLGNLPSACPWREKKNKEEVPLAIQVQRGKKPTSS